MDQTIKTEQKAGVWKDFAVLPKSAGMYICIVLIDEDGHFYQPVGYQYFDGERWPKPILFNKACKILQWLDPALAPETNEPDELRDAADEREVMVHALDEVRKLFEGRQWIMDGRGSYPYNDDRYKEEVRYMWDEFDEIFKAVYQKVKSKTFEYRDRIKAEAIASILKTNEPERGYSHPHTEALKNVQACIGTPMYAAVKLEAVAQIIKEALTRPAPAADPRPNLDKIDKEVDEVLAKETPESLAKYVAADPSQEMEAFIQAIEQIFKTDHSEYGQFYSAESRVIAHIKKHFPTSVSGTYTDPWTSVDDLPGDHIAWCLGYVTEVTDLGISRYIWIVQYSKLHGWTNGKESFNVTHWMPLPAPPTRF